MGRWRVATAVDEGRQWGPCACTAGSWMVVADWLSCSALLPPAPAVTHGAEMEGGDSRLSRLELLLGGRRGGDWKSVMGGRRRRRLRVGRRNGMEFWLLVAGGSGDDRFEGDWLAAAGGGGRDSRGREERQRPRGLGVVRACFGWDWVIGRLAAGLGFFNWVWACSPALAPWPITTY
ncbi:unnamed protein product [Linum trigynum]